MRPDTLVYLSGPIAARDGFTVAENCNQAIRVFWDLLRRGIPAFCPHLSGDETNAAGVEYETWMAYDLAVLVRCTHVLLLPRWASSPGARREVAFANRRGIPILHSVDALDRALANTAGNALSALGRAIG